MLALAILVLIQAGPVVSPEAEKLGRRLAATSGIVALAPMLIEKDIQELSKELSTATPQDRQRLSSLGHEQGRQGLERLTVALGHAYASRLSVPDLQILVVQNESLPAVRRRSAEPGAMLQAMQALGKMDMKKDVADAFCKQTGKLCRRK